jgi:hypothetical protein
MVWFSRTRHPLWGGGSEEGLYEDQRDAPDERGAPLKKSIAPTAGDPQRPADHR